MSFGSRANHHEAARELVSCVGPIYALVDSDGGNMRGFVQFDAAATFLDPVMRMFVSAKYVGEV